MHLEDFDNRNIW